MGHEQNNTKVSKWTQISERERYQIEALLKARMSPKEISKQMRRDRRTIQREISRGSVIQRDSQWRDGMQYCADAGQRVHDKKAMNKGRPLKIGHDHKLAEYIEQKIGKQKYSPDAVIGEIRVNGLKFETQICTKTLYNYIDAGIFLAITNTDLPVKRNKERGTYRRVRRVALNNTKGRSIEERPKNIENRKEAGHWEMDCVVGSGRSCLLVMTERKDRKELIFKLKEKKQECVKEVINRLERKYKGRFSETFRSITMDNGSEFLNFKAIETSCLKDGYKRTVCYYAHPYSAYERGSNEVGNKLIRRFVPKGFNIDKLTNTDVHRIENWMNNYPRRMFGYKTSNDMCSLL